jgi:hypothetical protein
MFLNDILVPYIVQNFSDSNCYQLNIHLDSRLNILKIYITYILPLLEYACELWDGCCSRDADKLEQLQLEAARIITGLNANICKQVIFIL